MPPQTPQLSFWKSLKKSPIRSIVAICGVATIAALVLRKKPVAEDENVEDFTSHQQVLLERVRQIWDEHNARAKAHAPNAW